MQYVYASNDQVALQAAATAASNLSVQCFESGAGLIATNCDTTIIAPAGIYGLAAPPLVAGSYVYVITNSNVHWQGDSQGGSQIIPVNYGGSATVYTMAFTGNNANWNTNQYQNYTLVTGNQFYLGAATTAGSGSISCSVAADCANNFYQNDYVGYWDILANATLSSNQTISDTTLYLNTPTGTITPGATENMKLCSATTGICLEDEILTSYVAGGSVTSFARTASPTTVTYAWSGIYPLPASTVTFGTFSPTCAALNGLTFAISSLTSSGSSGAYTGTFTVPVDTSGCSTGTATFTGTAYNVTRHANGSSAQAHTATDASANLMFNGSGISPGEVSQLSGPPTVGGVLPLKNPTARTFATMILANITRIGATTSPLAGHDMGASDISITGIIPYSANDDFHVKFHRVTFVSDQLTSTSSLFAQFSTLRDLLYDECNFTANNITATTTTLPPLGLYGNNSMDVVLKNSRVAAGALGTGEYGANVDITDNLISIYGGIITPVGLNVLISGNTIRWPVANPNTTTPGIYDASGVSNTTQYAQYGHVRIVDNDIAFNGPNGDKAFELQLADTIVADNHVSLPGNGMLFSYIVDFSGITTPQTITFHHNQVTGCGGGGNYTNFIQQNHNNLDGFDYSGNSFNCTGGTLPYGWNISNPSSGINLGSASINADNILIGITSPFEWTAGDHPNLDVPIKILGQHTLVLASNFTNANTTFTTVTDGTINWSWPVFAQAQYSLFCTFLYQGATATTNSPNIQITGPASPTAVIYGVSGYNGTTFVSADASSFSTSLNPFGTLGTDTSFYMANIYMTLNNGNTAGTIAVQAKNTTGTDVMTILKGSGCTLQ